MAHHPHHRDLGEGELMRSRLLVAALVVFALVQRVDAAGLDLLASSARTASGTFTPDANLSTALARSGRAAFQLTVSAAATDVGDTLDVYLQSSLDGGTTWDDFVHFTQVLGNGGTKKFIAAWSATITPTTALGAPADAALAAGVKQGPIGPQIRVKWVIVDADVDGSFTFGIKAQAYPN
jgi:hypothetical protein